MSKFILERDATTGVVSAAFDSTKLGLGFTYLAVTTNVTLSSCGLVVDVDTSGLSAPATLEIRLPSPVAGGIIFLRKVIGLYDETITLLQAGSEKINGVAGNYLLYGSNESVYGGPSEFNLWPTWLITSNGTDWRVSIISQQVMHTRQSGAPTGDELSGYFPGSTWCESVQDPASKLHINVGTDAGDADWMRIDAVDVTSVTYADSPYSLPRRDRQIDVDTSGGVVVLGAQGPTYGSQMVGVQIVVLKVNTGTNKITLNFTSSTTVNGVGVTSFDLPGSSNADYGRWHITFRANKVWVSGGAGLV